MKNKQQILVPKKFEKIEEISIGEWFDLTSKDWNLRYKFTNEIGWHIPTKSLIDLIIIQADVVRFFRLHYYVFLYKKISNVI